MTSYADGIVLISNGTNVVTVFNDIKKKDVTFFIGFRRKILANRVFWLHPWKKHFKDWWHDIKRSFTEHVSKFCRKVNQKLHATVGISCYFSTNKLRFIMNAFFSSHFGHCRLLWMFHNRCLNIRINKLKERALHLVYKEQLPLLMDCWNKRTLSHFIREIFRNLLLKSIR